MIGGNRVSSRISEPMKPHMRRQPISDENLRIVEAIPYWLQSISTYKIAKVVGLKHTTVVNRLCAIQDRYMIFGEGGTLSRFTDDMSNIEIKADGEE